MNQAVDAQTFAPMECQAVNGQSIAPVAYQAVNLLDSGYAGDASQGQTASYLPSTGSEAASWTANGVDSQSTDKGVLSNSTYNHGQQTEQPIRNVQDGQNVTPTANPSILGSENAYNSFASYSNSVDPYGYGSSGYQGYYNGYQQQSAHSYSQQQPNQTYSQPQPNYSYSQQQPIHSYSQPLGAYQNTGAPHQPLSSFQNSEFYAGTANYSSTYYNTADYQTAGGYPSSGYSYQSTPWNTGTHANYTSSHYTNYTSHTSGHISGSAASTSVNYQQHYKQWADYYSQTQVICAPGTEHLSSSSTPNQGSSVSSGYTPSNNQPAPSPTPLWRPESTPSGSTSLQPAASSSGAHDGYWKQGAPNLQNQFASPVQPVFQNELDSKATYDNFQEQKKPSLQGSNLLYPVVNQVTSSYQSPQQTLPSLDTRKVGKFQIPTNPRIASNLAFGSSKPNKEGSAAGTATKPAYVGVSVPKPNNKVLWDDASNSMLKPGMFPQSLRRYVERAFLLCKDDAQRAACQGVMKEIITKATADGTLNTHDWDAEPLFPLPKPDVVNMETSQFSTPVTSFANKRSLTRRSKSRWEPLPDEKPVDNPVPANNDTTINCGGWDRKPLSGNSMSKDGTLNSIRFSLSDQKTGSKISQRPLKRQRLADVLSDDSGDASSNSDKEHSLTAYKSGPIPLANSPEEKRRRENRSRRFEKGHGHRVDFSDYKPKNAEVGNLYSKRASALMLSKSFDDGGSNAVEDINWDVLTVKGTCQEVEKRYLRLTSAPDPSTVRPEEVLEKALLMVQNSQKNYLYKCDQLKSIRQDLTVQRIRNELTVKVYETHARLALEVGDLPEYNQCQSQLKTLYAEGIEGCDMEFAAYNLLCVILHSNNNRDLLTSMSRLTEEARKDKAVKHALAVRAAVTSGNYVMFFRLYKMAPNLNTCLMDPSVEKMRYKAVSCMSRAYRPSIPVSYAAQILGFSSTCDGNNEKGLDGLEECEEWLKAHGACITTDNNGELQLDTKASSSSLYLPEPEDAVAHGDANLAVNDFLARAPLSVAS